MLVLIMAGGSGTRLWPLSRKKNPKQLLALIGEQTLLQATYGRLNSFFRDSDIFLATAEKYFPAIKKQLPKISAKNYSLEPVLKDRGPAIALAVLIMEKNRPKSVFVTAWSDHYIKNTKAYFDALKEAQNIIASDPETFVCIGVKPNSAHTGFGYIQKGRKLPIKGNNKSFTAQSFLEKPDIKTAQKLVKSEKYLWNTGYFVCRTDVLLSLYQKYLPQVYKILKQIEPYIGKQRQQKFINKFYPKMPKVDIEKGLVEKLKKTAVVEANFDWADIGSFKIIKDVLSKDHENLTKGFAEILDSSGNLIYNYENKLVAVVGMKDTIVVNTNGALLIANKHESEKVKKLVEKLQKNRSLKKYL